MRKAVTRNNQIVERQLESLTQHSDAEERVVQKLEHAVRAQVQLQNAMITQANALQGQLAALPQRVVEVQQLLHVIRALEGKFGIFE